MDFQALKSLDTHDPCGPLGLIHVVVNGGRIGYDNLSMSWIKSNHVFFLVSLSIWTFGFARFVVKQMTNCYAILFASCHVTSGSSYRTLRFTTTTTRIVLSSFPFILCLCVWFHADFYCWNMTARLVPRIPIRLRLSLHKTGEEPSVTSAVVSSSSSPACGRLRVCMPKKVQDFFLAQSGQLKFLKKQDFYQIYFNF